MKKVLKSKIFICLIVGICCLGIGVYGATKYQASEILYNPSSGDNMTVNEALDELYNKYGSNSNIPEPVSFAEDSWETIVANVKVGNTSKYKLGDTKEIELTGFTNGETGSNGLYTIRIANTSTPEECSTDGFSQTACGFVIEFVDIMAAHNMNSTNTNVGGWQDSEMRTYVNDTIYNALPNDLSKNIIDTYAVSGHGSSDTANFITNDKVYLLSNEEIWGGSISYDAATSETRQLDYYKNYMASTSNYSVAIKTYNGSGFHYWLRSAYSGASNTFCRAYNGGPWHAVAGESIGVALAFRIG